MHVTPFRWYLSILHQYAREHVITQGKYDPRILDWSVFIRQVDGVFDEHFSTAMGSCLEIELVHTTNLTEVHHFAPVLIGSEERVSVAGTGAD
jgi:hypothetical protein